MSPNTPHPPMGLEQLNEIISWHRAYGLALRLAHSEAGAVTLDGLAGGMVTEILRLARLGLVFQVSATLPEVSPETRLIHAMVAEAAVDWEARIRG